MRARSVSVAVLNVCRKRTSVSGKTSSLSTPDSISSSEALIDSSEGGSLDSSPADRSRTAAETRNAPALAKQTACRPRASQVRLIVIGPSPLLVRQCHREPFARVARPAGQTAEAQTPAPLLPAI